MDDVGATKRLLKGGVVDIFGAGKKDYGREKKREACAMV